MVVPVVVVAAGAGALRWSSTAAQMAGKGRDDRMLHNSARPCNHWPEVCCSWPEVCCSWLDALPVQWQMLSGHAASRRLHEQRISTAIVFVSECRRLGPSMGSLGLFRPVALPSHQSSSAGQ